jgi:hypothetical protein
MLITDAHHAAVGAIAVYEPRTGDEEPWGPIQSAPS